MRLALRSVLATLVGYVLGNLPSAAVAQRAARGNHDLATEGTGNPGAANAAQVLGPGWGVTVSVADVAKATLAARLGGRLAGAHGANVAATAAVIGHCHPIGRAGGKGVAASIGHVIGTVPAYLPLDIVAAATTAKLPWFRHRTRAATSAGSIVWIATTTVWWRRRWPNPGAAPVTWTLPAGAVVSSAVIARRFKAEAARVDAHNGTIQNAGSARGEVAP
ncbi:MAG: glycerol-3-phosphate acyltransferase [Actinomycetota bacterium]